MNSFFGSPVPAGSSQMMAQSTTTGTVSSVSIDARGPSGQKEQSIKRFESAVYSHLKAMRTLGKTAVNTAEVARALGLTVSQVDQTLNALKKKGVRIAS